MDRLPGHKSDRAQRCSAFRLRRDTRLAQFHFAAMESYWHFAQVVYYAAFLGNCRACLLDQTAIVFRPYIRDFGGWPTVDRRGRLVCCTIGERESVDSRRPSSGTTRPTNNSLAALDCGMGRPRRRNGRRFCLRRATSKRRVDRFPPLRDCQSGARLLRGNSVVALASPTNG